MLDGRLYRVGWVPVLFAVILAAFSLRAQPAGTSSSLSAQAFDGGTAARVAADLAASPAYRPRDPGAAGDDRLAARMGSELRRLGFAVTTTRDSVRTLEGDRRPDVVVGRRTGFSERQVAVVADRTSLGATSALLELARVLGGRTARKTTVLASVAGGAGGGATAALADTLGTKPDAVIVLGPVEGGAEVKPMVVPWSTRSRGAAIALRRTVERALRAETGRPPGAYGFLAQLTRLAFPLTMGAQGPLVEDGVPAVLVAPRGERPANGEDAASAARLGDVGRGVLRAESALDTGPDVGAPTREVVLARHVLPTWPVRLLVLAGLLPALLAVVDGVARVNRRRQRPWAGLRWALTAVVPFLLAVVLARVLGVTGVIDTTPVLPGAAADVGGVALAAIALTAAVLVAGWLLLRPLLLRLLGVVEAPAPGRAAGALLLALLATLVLWVQNPFAAALVLLALHLWLLAAVPDLRPSRRAARTLALLGALPAVLVALSYAFNFGLGPLSLLWNGFLAVAGGAVGIPEALVWSVVAGAFAAVLVLSGEEDELVPHTNGAGRVRGPVTYAGPGSLGGTRSARRR